MTIHRLELKRLSPFQDAAFDFSPGINVLIGANSSGKTHVLKWLYASAKALEQPVSAGEDAATRLTQKIAAVFLPEERRVGRLVKRTVGKSTGELRLTGSEGSIHYKITTQDKLTARSAAWSPAAPAVFLPSREVLALYEGFAAAYVNRELSIDETYYDACVALSASGLRGPRGELARSLMESVDRALGGSVILEGGRFYVRFKADVDPKLEAHLVAEGLRKVGGLARLIQNGSLLRQGLLIWDEPEASLNPRLISAVAAILQELALSGVQIILATHDYLLARRLSMMSEGASGSNPLVRFFLLSRPALNAPVEVASGTTLAELPRTPMEEEFLRLYADERAAFADEGA